MEDTTLHERVSVLEANTGSMNKSIEKLSDSISDLNNKLDAIGSRFSQFAGIAVAILFIFQFVIIPIVLTVIYRKVL